MIHRGSLYFDGWTLDPRSGEITRAGTTQRLAPQPLAMLLELLADPHELVTREHMAQVLWPQGVVDFDGGLNAVVRKLRMTLGDDAEAPRYIETLPRRGYRFLADVSAAPGQDTNSDELVSAAVASPAGSPGAAARAAARTAVPLVVPARARWRLAAAVGALLIAGTVTWWLPPIGKQTSPPSTASARAEPARSTSERAYELYLQGTFNRSRRDINGADLAVASFEEALREDPQYADGWAALAETWSGTGMALKEPVSDAYGRARAAALRAIEIDPKLAHAHAAIAHISLHYDRDFATTERELETALQEDPQYARIWHTLGLLRAYQGRVPEAFAAIRRARELEPMAPLYNVNYGMLLYHARRYDEAVEHARLLLGSQPRFDQARSLLVRSLVARGDAAAALEQLPLRVSERVSVSDAGLVYARLERGPEALAEIDAIEQLGQGGFGVAYDVAVIRAALGDHDGACAALRRALDDHSLTLPWLRLDPRMDSLRDLPCYSAVAADLYGK